MKIEIDLDHITKYDLSPNQYVALWLIHNGISDRYPLGRTIESLIETDWVTSDMKINNSKVHDGFFLQQKEPLSKWIDRWLCLWPTILLPSGYRISGNTMECKKRMITFLKNFPQYDKETIIGATINYLKRQEELGWSYTKKNSKFIYDSETSVLEQECEAFLNGQSDIKTNTIDF